MTMLIDRLIYFYSLIVVARVVISWLELPGGHPVTNFLCRATEPVLKPIRDALPTTGGIDFAPLVLLIGLQILGGIF